MKCYVKLLCAHVVSEIHALTKSDEKQLIILPICGQISDEGIGCCVHKPYAILEDKQLTRLYMYIYIYIYIYIILYMLHY